MLMIEDTQGIANLADILKKVPGIGPILIGEGDLSQELGFPRQYEHPGCSTPWPTSSKTCKENKVAVGHPHVDATNVERILGEGYTFLMAPRCAATGPRRRHRRSRDGRNHPSFRGAAKRLNPESIPTVHEVSTPAVVMDSRPAGLWPAPGNDEVSLFTPRPARLCPR